MRFLRFLRLGLTWVLGSFAAAWTAGALYFDLPAPAPLRTFAAITWALAAMALGLFGGWRGRLTFLLAVLLVAGWWSNLHPRLDRDWQPRVAMLAYAIRDGDRFTVHNVRNFEYRTAADFTPRYETRNYDLANLRALDLFVNYWGSPLMAHPILSFDFGPQGHLCFSIETRPERGKAYSTVGGCTGSMSSFTSRRTSAMSCVCGRTLKAKTFTFTGWLSRRGKCGRALWSTSNA